MILWDETDCLSPRGATVFMPPSFAVAGDWREAR